MPLSGPMKEEAITDNSPPKGITFEHEGADTLVIRHQRTGMACMNLFGIVWLAIWTPVCVLMLWRYLDGGVDVRDEPIPLVIVLFFWAAEIIVGCIVIEVLFNRKTFCLDPDNLLIDSRTLRFRSLQMVPRDAVVRVVQSKDGGEGRDSFPSRGLDLETDKEVELIYRQPYEQSLWLGQVMARWAGVKFEKVEKA